MTQDILKALADASLAAKRAFDVAMSADRSDVADHCREAQLDINAAIVAIAKSMQRAEVAS